MFCIFGYGTVQFQHAWDRKCFVSRFHHALFKYCSLSAVDSLRRISLLTSCKSKLLWSKKAKQALQRGEKFLSACFFSSELFRKFESNYSSWVYHSRLRYYFSYIIAQFVWRLPVPTVFKNFFYLFIASDLFVYQWRLCCPISCCQPIWHCFVKIIL